MSDRISIRIGREPFNGYSHLLGAVLVLVAGAFLLARESDPAWLWWVRLFYVGTLFGAMLSSAAYHLLIEPRDWIERLRKLDHWCIRGLIVGTFSPLAFEMLSVLWALVWMGVLLLMVLVDAVLCSRGPVNRARVAASYIVIASTALFAVPFLWAEHRQLILWVSSGSLFYIIGAYCYLMKVPRGAKAVNFHEVWHLCVMVGALIHYTAIYHIS